MQVESAWKCWEVFLPSSSCKQACVVPFRPGELYNLGQWAHPSFISERNHPKKEKKKKKHRYQEPTKASSLAVVKNKIVTVPSYTCLNEPVPVFKHTGVLLKRTII
ncbi:hypothetical protein RJT34_03759 [Clitoria ternatea]|uniref:Uncharacterized protein n=1 Tax=Clitoria ternatea TaxID=43366 RepID=A0AAN9KKS0_CLITE